MAKMTNEDWGKLKFFDAFEFETPEEMEQEVVFLLDAIRAVAGAPFRVHESFSLTGHETNSLHKIGGAIDGHFEGLGVIEQYLLCEQFRPAGLGFYPFWSPPGIHIDSRSLMPYQKAARWWRDAGGIYRRITVAAIKQFIWREGERT